MKATKALVGTLCIGAAVLAVIAIVLVNPKTAFESDGSYSHFTGKETFLEVLEHPAYDGYGRHLIPGASTDLTASFHVFETILGAKGNWVPSDILDSLNTLIDEANTGNQIFYDYYSEEEMNEDDTKADTCLAFLKGNPGAPFIVLTGGGAYKSVAFINEGIASGLEFQKMGYNVFVLKYRAEASLQEDLNMSPYEIGVQDYAKAMEYILARADKFEINPENYASCGFSAGANLAQGWGSEEEGYGRFGLPEPACMMLIYGANVTLDGVNQHIFTAEYPPVYTIACDGDMEMILEGMREFDVTAKELGLTYETHIFPNGGHGFGRGTGIGAEGWPAQAAAFWESVSEGEQQ